MKLIIIKILPVLLIIVLVWMLILIRKNSVSGDVLYKKGMEEYELANYQKAKRLFIRAIAKKSDFFEALLRLGLLYFKLLDYEAAKKCFEQIIETVPNNFIATYNLALTLQMMKLNDEAKNFYRKAISLNDKDVDSYFNLGLISFGEKNFIEALGLFERANLLSPNQTQVQFYIVKCKDELCKYDSEEETQEIINSYMKISSKNDIPPEYYSALTKAHAKNGNIKEALEFCKKSLQANPEDAESYKLYGLISMINNDMLAAKTNLTIALQLDPDNEEIYNMMKYI